MFGKTVQRYANILHLRFQPTFAAMPPAALNKVSPNSFFRRLLKVGLYKAGRLIPNLFSPAPKNESLQGKIWLYVVSQNNYDALHFLKEQLPETVFVAGQNKQIGRYNKQVNRLSLRWKLFYTARYFFPVFIGLYKMHGRKAIRFFDLIFISIGYYEQYLTHLKKYHPKAVVFANDHNDDSRAMLLAANQLNIPTIYIQHATVSTAFPPLEFSLSLLEGQDALDKYRQCGPVQGEVKLIGMPKADKFMQFRNFKPKVESVGIAGNLMDDYEALKQTILQLIQHFPELRFTFRPHPGDSRDFSFVQQAGKNATFSSPKTENAFEFLKNQDLIIAAESSIHLEAALLNIPGIYFRFGASNFYDYYGFVKTGLITEATTLENLIKQLQQYRQTKPEVYRKAAYYNATIGTENEGKSDVLAVQYIREFLQKNATVSGLKTTFMLTAEIIFNYVWLHFCSLYPEAKKLHVAYGETENAEVKIAGHGLTFFDKKLPFPEEICHQNWNGQNIPFLFQTELNELISETGTGIKINADIIAGAFYFLSGWQEVYSEERDRFGRFPYHASLQCKHHFATVPVVNYYFDILKTALEKRYGNSLKNPENQFTTFLSHDVDRLESAWKVEGLRQLKNGNLLPIPKLILQKLRGKDHWHNLKTVAKTVKKLRGTSTFFWLAQSGKFQNHPNADYEISEKKTQQLIQCLKAEGFENGIHGSFGSSENAAQLEMEAGKLNTKISGNRFHYLCFDPEKTPQVLTEAGINYDSTLGFAEHFGFRNAYCFPFRLFDFSTLKPYPFLEIPLNLMDATLWHPNYLQISPEKIAATIKPMLQEIEKFGGVFGLLWHNENFSELNTQNGLQAFKIIMSELQNKRSQFKTGAQLYREFSKKLSD